jgi:hypothetical protein
MLGGGIAFWLGYLANFLHLEQQPVYDPAGYLEVLNEGVLVQSVNACVNLRPNNFDHPLVLSISTVNNP